MNDLSMKYFYKKFEFWAGPINLISDFFFVWVGLPLLLLVLVRISRQAVLVLGSILSGMMYDQWYDDLEWGLL
jgi:hypothetical protein